MACVLTFVFLFCPVRDVLLQKAPKSLVDEFCVSKTHLEAIEAVDNERDQAQFASNSWYHTRWLLEVDQPQTIATSTTNLVMLGRMQCGSDDELVQKCEEFALHLGMDKFKFVPQQPVGEWGGYGLHAKVRESMHYALPTTKTTPKATLDLRWRCS
jgi:hypothetical protein